MRSLEFAAEGGREVHLDNLQEKIGQAAHRSPSVFNYYDWAYQSAGLLTATRLHAPEAELLSTPYLIAVQNGLDSLLRYGLTSCDNGLAPASSGRPMAAGVPKEQVARSHSLPTLSSGSQARMGGRTYGADQCLCTVEVAKRRVADAAKRAEEVEVGVDRVSVDARDHVAELDAAARSRSAWRELERLGWAARHDFCDDGALEVAAKVARVRDAHLIGQDAHTEARAAVWPVRDELRDGAPDGVGGDGEADTHVATQARGRVDHRIHADQPASRVEEWAS